MKPQSVGMPETNIVLGKHSGRNAVREHLKKMGYQLSEGDLNKVSARVKELADMKKEIYDEDLEAILFEEVFRVEDKYKLIYLNVVSGTATLPTATVQMEINKEIIQDAGFGVGSVDATFSAIRKVTRSNYPLTKYAVNAITGGTDALGQVTVQLRYNERSVVGRGTHSDVIVASAKAYVNALNRLEYIKGNQEE
jgi:2-isopropylmalate synthase